MLIDLHAHSTASDGTSTPRDLVAAAAAAGIKVLALTDHDGWSGIEEAADALPPGMTLVPGVEISCVMGDTSVHLLGYLCDPARGPLAGLLEKVLLDRAARLDRMLSGLSSAGVEIEREAVIAKAGRAAGVGRPHLAAAIIEAGHAESTADAFDRWLAPGRPGNAGPAGSIPAATAVAAVVAAGGVPVLAHPRAKSRGKSLTDADIAALKPAGLWGLEVDHPHHRPDERAQLRALANELGLRMTGSSDFHGLDRDPTRRLGAESTAPDVYAELLEGSPGLAPIVG